MKPWGKLLSSATPRARDHMSIWSVSERDARTFFRIAGTFWVVALVFIVYKSVDDSLAPGVGADQQEVWRCVGDSILGVLADFGTVAIGIGVLSMLLARPANGIGEVMMSLYQAVINRLVIPVIEAHKEEGRTEVMEQWRGWNERRVAAEREGREFDELPPGEGSNQAVQ